MTALASPRPARHTGVARWLRWILAAQVALGVGVFTLDAGRLLSLPGARTDAPDLTAPVSPGDQTRRFRPNRLPAEIGPVAPPERRGGDMPDRLRIETATVGDRPALALTGAIEVDDARRVAEWLASAAEPPALVLLDSPGGSVRDALAIGQAIRDAGADTALEAGAICLSACPYMLAGGVARSVAEGASVGVHQHYFGHAAALPLFLAVEDIQHGQGEVMAHLIAMGVDPAIMAHALVTPPDAIYLLTPDQLALYRLTTTGPADQGG
jgi:hypothetical protein